MLGEKIFIVGVFLLAEKSRGRIQFFLFHFQIVLVVISLKLMKVVKVLFFYKDFCIPNLKLKFYYFSRDLVEVVTRWRKRQPLNASDDWRKKDKSG